jgi:signal transduction histidine kinase
MSTSTHSLPPEQLRAAIEATSIENLPFGYIVTNTAHEVLRINYAARELLAVPHDVATLEQVVVRIPTELAILDHVKYCSIEHKSCNFRQVKLGDKLVRVFLSPIFAGDDLQGNLLTLQDITETVNQERARDQFLSFLVHELRTPLTAIHGNSELIRDYYKDALRDKSLNEMIKDISSGSSNLLAMVSEFLDMGRLEEGRVEYDLQEFEAVAVVRETVRSLDVIAQERGLKLVFEDPTFLVAQVTGDPGRFKQVLTNLIGNGLKFTEAGSVTVRLEKSADTELRILVSDTGPGIPVESQANMFQKYFQASNNKFAHDSAKSTGLGLYVTKLMVEGMDGHIALLSSEVGRGSTFMCSLKLATPTQLKSLSKRLYDAKQGVEHAPAEDHQSMLLTR